MSLEKYTVEYCKDGSIHIAYIPELNLSGYGDTVEEAEQLLTICLKDEHQDKDHIFHSPRVTFPK